MPKRTISPSSSRGIKTDRRFASQFQRDKIAIVETNVDDVTGEVVGVTIERLIHEGAYDVTVSSYLGKKGRTGQTIRVVCNPKFSEKFAQILVEETGTLGVKMTEYTRLVVPRKVVSVPVNIGQYKGNVSVKVALFGKNPWVKAELEDAKRISESEGIPLRGVLELVTSAAENHLGLVG